MIDKKNKESKMKTKEMVKQVCQNPAPQPVEF